MGTGPRAEESGFSWPPSTSDLAAIDVMEFTSAATSGESGSSSTRSAATGRVSTSAGVHEATPRPRRRMPRARSRMRAWAAAAPRRPRAHHLLLLGLGMLVGIAVPDLGGQWSFATRDTDVALASSASSPEAARLLAMRATLRGEAPASLQVAPGGEVTSPGTQALAAAAGSDEPGPADGRSSAASSDQTTNAWTASSSVSATSHEIADDATDDVEAREATPPLAPAASSPNGGSAVATRHPVRSDPHTAPVHGVMRSFETAWTRMDTAATLAVWPTAKVDVLTRAFTNMREQRLRLAPCRVARTGTRATATCEGTLRYRPRVGDHSTRVRRDRWDFDLEQTGRGVWQIRRVKAH